jgi:hypothetical protein
MNIKQAIYKILEELEGTDYLGNCVDLIQQFNEDGEDTGEAAQWMQNVLGDEENIYRLSEKDFYRFVNGYNVPSSAKNGKDREYYYIFNGSGHPNGFVNFVLYSTNKRGDDIHYFFNVAGKMEEEIQKLPKIENGFGAGEKM